MRCPFEWVVGDSSKDHHGDRAHVQDGAATERATPLYGALLKAVVQPREGREMWSLNPHISRSVVQ